MLAPRFMHPISLLFQAFQYTAELACDQWDFAVEIDLLRRTGLTNSDIRWLLVKGFVTQAVEIVPPPVGRKRAFTPCPSLVLEPGSCFILTPEGFAFAAALEAMPVAGGRLLWPGAESQEPPSGDPDPGGRVQELELPCWDKDRRMLLFRERIVKHFKVPAPNQELVLAVFQEEGWPRHIDDPLPHVDQIDPKRRLHDTIATLNRNQRVPLLRFFGDGNGLGLCWEAQEGS
jgi:hypothetical protein